MYFRIQILSAGLLVLLLLPITAIRPEGGYGQVSVKKWADGRKSAFTFTFDDACMSQYTYATPVLDSFGFKGTFFVISGSGFMTDSLPGIGRFGTWNQFRSMALEGHEIGSHTVTHPYLISLPTGDFRTVGTLIYELVQSKNTIEQKITNQKCISLAYPYFIYNSNVKNETAIYYEGGRGGSIVPIDISLPDSGFYSIGGKEEEFNTPRNSIQDDLDELQDMENYEQSSITDGKWGMLEAHEVVPF